MNKLKNQYKLLDKEDLIITKKEAAQKALKEKVQKAQKETVKRVKQTEGEIWIKDED